MNAGDLGRDYEHCCELQKKANDQESAVSRLFHKALKKKRRNIQNSLYFFILSINRMRFS